MRRGWTWALPAFALLLVFVLGARLVARTGRAAYALPPERSAPSVDPVRVEPASLSDDVVFVGTGGDREDGWPRRSVDRTALRALLAAGRTHELTAQLEDLQADFEAEPRHERWIHEAALAFFFADPSLDAAIDAWAQSEGSSFAPFLARCVHLNAVGWDRRGERTIAATSREAIDGMTEAMTRAAADCERALELRPRLVVARQRLISMAAALGRPAEITVQLGRALEVCPTCLRVRTVAYMFRTPRWGGSLAWIRADADQAIHSHPEAPYLRMLAGAVDEELCQVERDPRRRLAHCDAAIAAGADAFLSRARARLRNAGEHPELAEALVLSDLESALDRDPQFVDTLTMHAERIAAREPERAIREYLTAARLDPTDAAVIAGVEWSRERTRLLAAEAARRGAAPEVERLRQLGRQLGLSADDVGTWGAVATAPLAVPVVADGVSPIVPPQAPTSGEAEPAPSP